MIPAIPSIPSVGAAESAGSPLATTAASSTSSGIAVLGGEGSSDSFSNLLGQAIDSLNDTTNNASNLSVDAAAGNASVADATVASTEADLYTQLASAVTDKAVQSLDTIMDMQF